MWGAEKATEMLEEVALEVVDIKESDGDPMNSFYIARKP